MTSNLELKKKPIYVHVYFITNKVFKNRKVRQIKTDRYREAYFAPDSVNILNLKKFITVYGLNVVTTRAVMIITSTVQALSDVKSST